MSKKNPEKFNDSLKKLDEALDEEPFVAEWQYYKYEIESDGRSAQLQVWDGHGMKIAIPFCKHMAKKWSKDFNKLSKILL